MHECSFRSSGGFLRCSECGNSFPIYADVRSEGEIKKKVDAIVAGGRALVEKVRGPGTELKKLLRKIGITASPDCSCNARARTMDERGIEWCEANLDEIVGWLREEATKRGLPFVDMAGRVLVRRAIANARKAADAERPPLPAGG